MAKLKMQLSRRNPVGTVDEIRPHKLTVSDLQAADKVIVRIVQQNSFREELLTLKGLDGDISDRTALVARNRVTKKSSQLHRLDPFVDVDGIIRVGGRLSQAKYQRSVIHPAILPRKHHVTTLLARYFHKKTAHQGRGMTTNEIRANGFWIIGCSSAVSRMISDCVTCRRHRGAVQEQKMADLPVDRVSPASPFTYCAVDYFGPFIVKEGRRQLKRYGALFTCMSSRAVHIEVADSLSTDSFINALRRFIAVRGPVRQIRSDCGTNFVGAQRELNHEAMSNYLTKNDCDYLHIDFKMNVPAASHQGGVWERQFRTVRSILNSMIDSAAAQLNNDSLRTLMCEVMTIINSRPLTTDNLNDPASLEPLTPNHLLTTKSKVILPPPGRFVKEDMYLRKQWRRVQYLANEFWYRWKREYLQNLQIRQKWTRPRRDACIGDVVLIQDSNLPRCQWQLARISEVYPDEDGHVRKVKLMIGDRQLDKTGKRTKTVSFLERPIQKVVLLLEAE